jgi:hypothetical protein
MGMFAMRGALLDLHRQIVEKGENAGPALIDTAIGKSEEACEDLAIREMLDRLKGESPIYDDLNARAMGVLATKAETQEDVQRIVAWFRAEFPTAVKFARSKGEIEEIALVLFKHKTPEDQRRIIATKTSDAQSATVSALASDPDFLAQVIANNIVSVLGSAILKR